MATTGLDAFDKTLQTTNIWLDEIAAEIGPDRQVAWHVLGAVLRTLRDRIPLDLAAHLGAQLPLLVRGLYYDQWHPAAGRMEPHPRPERSRNLDAFLKRVGEGLAGIRPVNVRDATRAVFRILSRHVDRGQVAKVVHALPEPIREFWPLEGTPPANDAARGQGARPGETAA
jgi:uncharacterized protein (DUF2267 family)